MVLRRIASFGRRSKRSPRNNAHGNAAAAPAQNMNFLEIARSGAGETVNVNCRRSALGEFGVHLDLVQGSVLAVVCSLHAATSVTTRRLRHAVLTAPRRSQDADSPGEQAGLRVGDVIVACDGHWMTASGVVSHVQAAQAVTFTVLRNWTVTL